eukprot:scaffold576_cov260-Pinguiococcus_pyrenoidosus.AAC.11
MTAKHFHSQQRYGARVALWGFARVSLMSRGSRETLPKAPDACLLLSANGLAKKRGKYAAGL